ncbi:uroporphyrinogen III methyltransferase [Bacteroidia bacterium]|nr:uroporphyrinogen III methyltransferase [Bacteroidia bacterium]
MKIKKILISQPQPTTPKNPYADLAKKYNLQIDFRQFIRIEGLTVEEFKLQKIRIAEYTAIVFNSKTGIDHFFRICKELKIVLSEKLNYFCISDSVANYLQKYAEHRRNHIFFPKGQQSKDNVLWAKMDKRPNEKYLFVLSNISQVDFFTLKFKEKKYTYSQGIFYRTLNSDMSAVPINDYQLLAFFSPQGIKSLQANFPNFQQGSTLIAAFGKSAAAAVTEAGLRLDIAAPTSECLSMPAAIEQYINKLK